MTEECPVCGGQMEEEAPMSAMGEPMYGRGVEICKCTNPRCSRFGK